VHIDVLNFEMIMMQYNGKLRIALGHQSKNNLNYKHCLL